MPPAARISDMHTCPLVNPGPVPHVGGPIIKGEPTVIIGFMPAARVSDTAICTGPPDMIAKGSMTVKIGFLPAARIGDTTVHGGVIVMGCPTVIIGDVGMGGGGGGGGAGVGKPAGAGAGGGAAAGATAGGAAAGAVAGGAAAGAAAGGAKPGGIPATQPKSPADAPKEINLPSGMDKEFDGLWKKSFPKGKSQEFGGTLVKDKDGNLSMEKTGGGTSGTFSPDRNVSKDKEIVGIFHTHPYDKSEGGHTDISLSGADAAYMINKGDSTIIAQSGDSQFMYLRTDKTPKNVDSAKMDAAHNKRIGELVGKGKSFSEASQIAAKETAKANGLAYYEGKDGEFTRVEP